MKLARRDAVDTSSQTSTPSEIVGVHSLSPVIGDRVLASVPQVIDVQSWDDRSNVQTGHAQAVSQVIIFAPPAHVVLIEAIDAIEVFPPNAEDTALERWLAELPSTVSRRGSFVT